MEEGTVQLLPWGRPGSARHGGTARALLSSELCGMVCKDESGRCSSFRGHQTKGHRQSCSNHCGSGPRSPGAQGCRKARAGRAARAQRGLRSHPPPHPALGLRAAEGQSLPGAITYWHPHFPSEWGPQPH